MPAVGDPYIALTSSDALAPLARDLDSQSSSLNLDTLAPNPFSGIALEKHAQPIVKRDQVIIQGIIPTYYDLSGPEPGLVVGIVLGSVAGFLLVVWLLFTLFNGGIQMGGGGLGSRTAMAGEEEIVVRRRRNSHGERSRVSRRTSGMREVSRSPRRSSARSNIIVDERRPERRTRSIIVEERRRVDGDDVVEVIEEDEESDYRPKRGQRRYR